MNSNATISALIAQEVMPASLVTSATNAIPFVETGYASISFMILCSSLVMLMTPGVGLLYSGLSRTKNALTIFMLSFLSYAVVSIQYVMFGFSLAFSEGSGNSFIGNFDLAGFSNVGTQAMNLTVVTSIPAIMFALYQMQFAAVTVAIVFGSVTERIRLVPSILFMFVWTTVVYDVVSYWTWSARGWIRNMSCLSTITTSPCQIGGLDFAGGGPVHMASGAAALAFCIFLGHRKRVSRDDFKPHSIINIFIGTALLWFGWFGFNAGSALAATPRAVMAGVVTTIAASAGALTWIAIDFVYSGKLSGLAFCSGALAGLVGITPASGYVTPGSAILIGVVTSTVCFYSTKAKEVLGYDDSLDAFGLHGVGGFVGSILTGLLATKNLVYSLDGSNVIGGAIDNTWNLLGYNLAGSLAIMAYSFVITLLLLFLINSIPGMKFRTTEEDELLGGDLGEMGEVAYQMIMSTQQSIGEMRKPEKDSFTQVILN